MASDYHREQHSSRKPSYLHLKRGIKTTYLSVFLHLSDHRILFSCLIFFFFNSISYLRPTESECTQEKARDVVLSITNPAAEFVEESCFSPPPLQSPVQSSLTYGKTVQCFQGQGIFQKAEGTLSVFLCLLSWKGTDYTRYLEQPNSRVRKYIGRCLGAGVAEG